MKTAMVLGAGGFIGSHLAARLKEEGFGSEVWISNSLNFLNTQMIL